VLSTHYVAKISVSVPADDRRVLIYRRLARLAARALLRLTVRGVENVPRTGGLLLAMNHLGDADGILVLGFAPRAVALLGKAEILGWPVIGAAARAYGMIPVRRGEPDRGALEACLRALASGRALLVFPEGFESPSHALVEAKEGAGFLALRSRAPVVPVAVAGTESVYRTWRRFRRPCVTLTFGEPFRLPPGVKRREATGLIMRGIAALLPPEYRGVYADAVR
jgi:1-acyl-sn-glycerol-3-phosphate acyltransferase